MRTYRRGDVWLANLGPVIGSEQGKTRPVVIVAGVTIALGPKEYPTEVRVRAAEGGLKKDSAVLLNQIRTIDKRRMIERWGTPGPETMRRLDEALKISLGLVPV